MDMLRHLINNALESFDSALIPIFEDDFTSEVIAQIILELKSKGYKVELSICLNPDRGSCGSSTHYCNYNLTISR